MESAKNLQDITEKLLIMGNVREGTLRTKRIDLKKIFDKPKERYPSIETECALEFLNGDETLILCLLENLIKNALSAGEHVRLSADTEGIRVWNNGAVLDRRIVKAINRGQEFLENRVGEHGYGIQICQEIARAHGWKLKYQSSEEEGTTAVCEF